MKKEYKDWIKNFDLKDTLKVLSWIESVWAYSKQNAFKKSWIKKGSDNEISLLLELHTVGWSSNEEIVDSLKEHPRFFLMFHTKWEMGGHYYFEIPVKSLGYRTVQELSKELKISRQSINRNTERFESITYGKGDRNKLYREK